MSFNQPFCVGGDLADGLESLEEDLMGHDPFEPFYLVPRTPTEYYVEAMSPGVSIDRFDRTHVKHVFCVYNEPMGHELCLTIYAELKDGRLVCVYEVMEDVHVGVQFWSADDRDAFLVRLRSDLLTSLSETACGPLFARVVEGRTVRSVHYVYPKTPQPQKGA